MITGAALLVGLVLSLTLGNPWRAQCQMWAPWLLKACVIGIGAGMNLQAVLEFGVQGFAFTAVVVLAVLALGFLLCWLLNVERATGVLVTVGTAICGGSAIAAIAPILRAKNEQMSMALITVFLLNAVALFTFPWLGHQLGLSEEQFGLLSALAVHDTSAVVATAMQYGPQALTVATAVKLTRTLWIIPVAFAAARIFRPPHVPKMKIPYFILGFLGMTALVTFVPELRESGKMVASIARNGLILTLFLIGAGVSRESFKQVGFRSFVLGVILWLCVAAAILICLKALQTV